MKTILTTTYAINPYKGSEDGMGWNFVLQMARFQRVIAITRENNRPAIEAYIQAFPREEYQNITFLYFDLPYWMRFWKRKGQGALLYFWMWQRALPAWIAKQNLEFDVVHNLNFHNDWTPSYLWKLRKPMVWGPVGHHPAIPQGFFSQLSLGQQWKERLTWAVKNLFWKLIPDVQQTARRSSLILGMNSRAASFIPNHQTPVKAMPSVASEDLSFQGEKDSTFRLISAGRLVSLKGFELSIGAFARFLERLPMEESRNCELLIVGSGPLEKKLRKMVRDLSIEHNVRFETWMPRPELLSLMSRSRAFLFPSHEGAGMVVSEALSFGLPVFCLKNSGPGEFVDETCGFRADGQTPGETESQLAQALFAYYQSPEQQIPMQQAARKRFETHFHWDRRGETLKEVYQSLLCA